MRKIDKIIIHCSATKLSMDVSADRIDEWHKKRGWNGIGYHYYVRKNGEIEKGRMDDVIGAHCKGHNKSSIGVCYEGGLNECGEPEDTRTDLQKIALSVLINVLRMQHPESTVHGHNEFSSKSCPCFDAQEEYN